MTTTTTTTCRFCRGDVAPGAAKCRHCGEWLQGSAPGASSPAFKVVFILILIAAAVCALIWAVSSSGLGTDYTG